MSEAPPLTDREFNATFREGATDDDIEAVLRLVILSSGPTSCAIRSATSALQGRGTRAECIEHAFKLG